MRGRLHSYFGFVLQRACGVALALALVAAGSAWLVAQAPKRQAAPVPAWQTAAGGHQEFDVVSVRQNKSGPPWQGGEQMTMNVPCGPDDNFVTTRGELSGPTFLEALRNQIGIKLVSEKGPYDYVIVEHIEHPTEN
jgi:hypothetical protein